MEGKQIYLIKAKLASIRWPWRAEKPDIADAKQRVARGAALLDARKGDWYHRVELGKIDMFSEGHCILGQVYGGFLKGVVELLPHMKHRVSDFGFIAQSDQRLEEWAALRREWTAQIVARRNQPESKGRGWY